MSNDRTILFLYELGHVDAARRWLEDHAELREKGYLCIALDPEIEQVLVEERMVHASAAPYRTPDAEPRIAAGDFAEQIFGSDRWSFFQYRGVSLARTYFFSLQVYLTEVLYWIDLLANVVARHPHVERLIVFPTIAPVPVMGSCLMPHWIRIPLDVARLVGVQSNKEVLVPAIVQQEQQRAHRLTFMLKRTVFGAGITLLNALVALVRRPQKIRIVVSDYWKNVGPVLETLGSVEAIFIDRLAAFDAGLAHIWKYRMRFLHLAAFNPAWTAERQTSAEQIARTWHRLIEAHDIPSCAFRGYTVQPLLVPALQSVIDESIAKTLADIDGAYGMVQKVRPHVIMLRATTSAQPHFSILAQVAREQGIPSLEMLHGLDYYGKGGSYRFHGASHVSIYGDIIKRQMAHIGPKDTQLHIVGSPRFDVYAQVQKRLGSKRVDARDGRIVFLCIAPVAGAGDIDMYDIIEFFSTIAKVVERIPNASVIIKLRPGNNRDAFVKPVLARLFAQVPHTIAQAESLWNVFPKADVVISCFSTAALEALQCGKPVVYLGLSPSQRMLGEFHFTPYAEYGAIRMALSTEVLAAHLQTLAAQPSEQELLSQKALAFLAQEYAFDGHSSERTAALIHALAQESSDAQAL